MKMITRLAVGIGLLFLALVASPGVSTGTAPLDPAEQAFLTLINDYRQQNGLGTLTVDSKLQDASEWMSNDMGVNNYFDHTDSLGRNPVQRMNYFGYTYNTWKGENLAAGFSSALAAFNGLKASPGHNANMLNPNYRATGIALVSNTSSTYTWYWTNDFGGIVSSSVTPTPPPPTTPAVTPTQTPPPVTPTPTVTPTPPPTPTKTPTPTPPVGVLSGDVDCDGDVDSVDALKILRYVAGLPNSLPPGCAAIGATT